jgi:hypothetical protein
MATDGEPAHPPEDDMLPDERELIAERAEDLHELDDEEFLSVEEVAEKLDIDLE